GDGAGLVQEAGLGEGGQRLADLGEMGLFGVQGGGQLGLDDGHPGPGEVVQGGVRVLEGGGEVAGVDADADAVVADRGQRCEGVAGGFDDAAGFGFQGDPDGASGEVLEGVEAFGEGAQGGAGGGGPPVVVGGAPGQRQGGDAAFGDVVGEQPGEDAGQGRRVLQPLGVGPVGLVDAVLDLVRAESLVGEAVEGDDLQAPLFECAAQSAQSGGVADEGAGGVPGEPQADAETVPAQAAADGLAVVAELGEDAVEGLGGVHVGAVGEVDGGAVGMAEAHGSRLRGGDGGRAGRVLGGAALDGVALVGVAGGGDVQVEPAAEPVEGDGVAPQHQVDVVVGEALGEHEVGHLAGLQRVALAPVGGGVHQHPLGAVFLQDGDHPVLVHLGVRVDGEAQPAAAVLGLLDGRLVEVVDQDAVHGQGGLADDVEGAAQSGQLVAVRGV